MSSEETWDNVQLEEIEHFSKSSGSPNGHLTELVYKLDWAVRDEIILNLNGYSRLLCGKAFGGAAKERLLQANASLYQRLINLPPTCDEQASNEEPRLSKVALELTFRAKEEIIGTLIANQSLSNVTANEETKLQMIKKNNWLVSKLMQLSVSVSEGTAEETDDQLSSDEPNELTTSSDMAGRIASLQKTNEDQQSKIGEQEKKIADLTAELNKLKVESKGDVEKEESKNGGETKESKLSALMRLADGEMDFGQNRKKAVVECRIGGISAFLKAPYGKVESGFFFCDDRCWSLYARRNLVDNRSYLTVGLVATNLTDNSADWFTRVYYSIELLNDKPCKPCKPCKPWYKPWSNSSDSTIRRKASSVFSNHGSGWEFRRFITIDNLVSGDFIKNDEIKFRVCLQVEKST